MSQCKNIVITGANRGIGLELVKQVLTHFKPDNVFATYRDPGNSQELLQLAEANANVHAIKLDVLATDSFAAVVSQVEEVTLGAGVNLLINNSGVLKGDKTLTDLQKDHLMYHLEVNTVAPILLTKAFLPLLEKGSQAGKSAGASLGIGRAVAVQMSSAVGSIAENGGGGNYAYRISKTALNQAAKNMSIELKDKGILVIPMHPGWVQTEMGGPHALITTQESVAGMLSVIERLNENENGHFKRFDGRECQW